MRSRLRLDWVLQSYRDVIAAAKDMGQLVATVEDAVSAGSPNPNPNPDPNLNPNPNPNPNLMPSD